jgi:hypothetical protein
MLNISKTHNLICNINHDITHCHDPVTDVVLGISLIFLIRKMGPIKLYNECTRIIKAKDKLIQITIVR